MFALSCILLVGGRESFSCRFCCARLFCEVPSLGLWCSWWFCERILGGTGFEELRIFLSGKEFLR
jgi:hypothetical protein